MKIVKFLFAVLILFSSLFYTSCGYSKDVVSFEAMSTFMTIQAYGSKAKKANQEAKKRVIYIEDLISTTKENSLIYNMNNSANEQFQLPEEIFNLFQFSLNISNESAGALNIALYPVTKAWGFTTDNYRLPDENEILTLLSKTDFRNIQLCSDNTILLPAEMEIDLGAVGKGFAGDEAIKILRQNGVTSALLDLGGNIQALGAKIDGSEWTIGVKNPWDGSVAVALKIKNQAVITSGGYERYFSVDDKKYIHIFDGKTGHPVENEISGVTIITESGLYGDALSTAMFVMGTEAACEYWKAHKNFEMIIFTDRQQMIYTSGLKNKLSPLYDFTEITVMD